MLSRAIRSVRKNLRETFGRHGQAKRQKDEIGIHAVRMGNITGIHEVHFGTDGETVTLKHTAHSRYLRKAPLPPPHFWSNKSRACMICKA